MKFQEKQPVTYVPTHLQLHLLAWVNQSRPDLRRDTDHETIQALLDDELYRLPNRLDVWNGQYDGAEFGLVSSWNDGGVFVKYHPLAGWNITSQRTSRSDLFTRPYLVEDRDFLDIPEYPGFNKDRHEYVICCGGSDGWTPTCSLMEALLADKLSAVDSASTDEEAVEIGATPWYDWVEWLGVFDGNNEIAEFNFDTWEWETDPDALYERGDDLERYHDNRHDEDLWHVD